MKWSSDYDGKKVDVEDKNIVQIINNGKKEVKLIDYIINLEGGKNKDVKAYQCTVPIFEGEDEEFQEFREDGEPVGFLRYVLTLEKMQDAMANEKAL